MNRVFSSIATAAAVCLVAASASAQPSIRVCEHRNFQGRCVTLRHGVNDLREWGISNRISSYRVDRGEWRLCTGVNFSGYCENVTGYIADLNATPLQDSISSLRPVREGGPGSGRGERHETAIAVYTLPDFRGRSWVFSDDIRDLSQLGLNNQVSSVRVFGGRWQICEQPNYRNCRDVMRDIRDLRVFGMDNRISSIREGGSWGWGRGDEGRGGDVGRGREGGRSGDFGGGRGGPGATLFEGPGFSGRAVEIRGAIRNLQGLGFNDVAMSIRVSGGRWQICEHEDFKGRCEIVDGSIGRLGPGLARRVSSIRPY